MPKVQTLDSEVLHSMDPVTDSQSWCFCDSGAVYKCDHLVSNVASLDIRSC